MPKKPAQRSSLFLLELIIAILFFILAATACVRFFVHSHELEKDSIALNQALLATTSVAEILRSQDEPYETLADAFPMGNLGDNEFKIYYDNDWSQCEAAEASYIVSLKTEYTEDNFLSGHISVLDQEEVIYDLTVDKYLGQEVSAE